MKKTYVSPEAVKVNFETKDIITTSGTLVKSDWTNWGGDGVMSISWNDLTGGNN